ncbi:MAG TPA: dethiobiotin synthase [Acidimicrobiales bacterium]|nr:dethiobiotin synthase [Acidimicrobiales bacterium]
MRPEHLVLVCGTGTDVGKTWVCSQLLRELRRRGLTVAARKPAQSFDVDSEGASLGGPTDAEVLAAASGEDPGVVCPSWRSYHRAMAPPMAAEALGRPAFSVTDLVGELAWPPDGVALGMVELAGGVRSPQASDGDVTHMVVALRPDVVMLVADAGLGCLNGVRLSMEALGTVPPGGPPVPTVVVLDRFDRHHDLHRRNRQWLVERDGYRVMAVPGEEDGLADLVTATSPSS